MQQDFPFLSDCMAKMSVRLTFVIFMNTVA